MSQPPCRPYLPPEWAEQDAVMLTWPQGAGDWGPALAEVEAVFARIAREIARRERLLLVCRDAAHRRHVDRRLREAGVAPTQVRYGLAPADDCWARDHGPLTVFCQDRPTLLDFRFNGWGGKYPAERDNRINRELYRAGVFGELPMERDDLVLEGGSIEVDGAGTLLTTESCLLSPGRNPALSREALEARLKERFGLRRILWLRHGHLLGDDTDGHIDMLARFCDVDTIAHMHCDDTGDEHHAPLAAMKAELESLRSARGHAYRLLPLPWPRPVHDAGGRRLPLSYANFLIINGAVLVPVYGDPADARALEQLARAFPDREAVAIPCLPLVRQYGSLHCVTMQLPKGVLP